MSERQHKGKSQESLADWVVRTTPGAQQIKPSMPTKLPAPLKQHSRFVTLQEWAATMFGDAAPHYNTLLRWVHERRIQPQPKKMGRRFWLVRDAEYRGD